MPNTLRAFKVVYTETHTWEDGYYLAESEEAAIKELEQSDGTGSVCKVVSIEEVEKKDA